jgi:translation initiation factor 4E
MSAPTATESFSVTKESAESWIKVGNKPKKPKREPKGNAGWSEFARNIPNKKVDNHHHNSNNQHKSNHSQQPKKLIITPLAKLISSASQKPITLPPAPVATSSNALIAMISASHIEIPATSSTHAPETVEDEPDTEKSTELNGTWTLFYHDLKNDNWELGSYEELFTFNTIEDFWRLYNNLTDLTNGMYYLMREGYPPIWEHEKNVGGGGWTFKVNKRQLNKFWETLSCYCVGETICEQPDRVVGLSISPKIQYATVRVWTADTTQTHDLYRRIAEETKASDLTINFATDARFAPNSNAPVKSNHGNNNQTSAGT